MNCPYCRNSLKECKLEHVIIDECEQCKGKWIEKADVHLGKTILNDNLVWLDLDLFGKDIEISEASEALCPCCQRKMQSLRILSSKVLIEKCKGCEGIWLKRKELLKILTFLGKREPTKGNVIGDILYCLVYSPWN